MTLRVALFGVGRLGREISALAPERQAEIVIAARRDSALTAADLLSAGADVAIDVSVADAVPAHVDLCLQAGLPIAIGVTGWQDAEATVYDAVGAANGCALIAPNFSIGATLFSIAVADAARRFSAALGFDAHIVETHHVKKVDAPSGTARRLATMAGAARGAEIPVTSVRVGHVPGIHSLILDAAFEQVSLTHEARDRRVFADGALHAARWILGRRGWFTMDDVVQNLIGESA